MAPVACVWWIFERWVTPVGIYVCCSVCHTYTHRRAKATETTFAIPMTRHTKIGERKEAGEFALHHDGHEIAEAADEGADLGGIFVKRVGRGGDHVSGGKHGILGRPVT
jgi:hypothetical protein